MHVLIRSIRLLRILGAHFNRLTLSAKAMDPTEHLHPVLSQRLQFINLHLSGTENTHFRNNDHMVQWESKYISWLDLKGWEILFHYFLNLMRQILDVVRMFNYVWWMHDCDSCTLISESDCKAWVHLNWIWNRIKLIWSDEFWEPKKKKKKKKKKKNSRYFGGFFR